MLPASQVLAVDEHYLNVSTVIGGDNLPFLFDRFFRISESRTRVDDAHPSGLGLSVAKQLCIVIGGNVSASLNSGRLTIKVTLPVRTDAACKPYYK